MNLDLSHEQVETLRELVGRDIQFLEWITETATEVEQGVYRVGAASVAMHRQISHLTALLKDLGGPL